MTLPRRLGLETASIPHADCHGLAWHGSPAAACRQQTAHSASRRPGAETLNRATMPWSIHCRARAVALKIFTSCLEFSPQSRGWTDSVPCFCMLVMVSPVSAGMDPLGGGSQ